MDIFDVITGRTSYRGKYKNIPVKKEDIVKILEAGAAAPSGCNKQTTSFIAVDDERLLRELKSLIVPPIAMTAPCFILVLTRKIFAYRDRCFNVQDYSAAIQNMLLAIKALGYESCWYEGHITDDDDIAGKLAKYMGIPNEYKIVCILPVGVAEDEIIRVSKKPLESRAWFNGFGGKPFFENNEEEAG
ncbi:MAG: nitroreductase family protein [Oscillospiraceae bacterium]|nr:nitroreductase family protein [Oscillospiraceae bacterium]